MKGFQAVVFDMDGVIFDSEKGVLSSWQEVAEKYQIPDIEQTFRDCIGLNAAATKEKMLQRYGQDFPYDAYKKEMSQLFHSRYDGGRLPMKPGVVELLSFLQEQGIKIALASSTRREVVLQELGDAGVLPYFQQVICGDMVKRSKPAPDIFMTACECLGVDVSEAYAIEDSYNGIRSAHSAGLRPIMVPDMAAASPEMEELTEHILPSLYEVKAYLKTMLGVRD